MKSLQIIPVASEAASTPNFAVILAFLALVIGIPHFDALEGVP
jgi:hypothetical protein